MNRFAGRSLLLGVIGAACMTSAVVVPPAPQAKSPAPRPVKLAAFHSRLGGSRFGGGLFSRRRTYGYGYRGRSYSRPSLLHRITRALAFAYILHLLFTNGIFSLLLWVLVIAVVSRLFRRRSRRYSY